jgi:ankyrin repeat protein
MSEIDRAMQWISDCCEAPGSRRSRKPAVRRGRLGGLREALGRAALHGDAKAIARAVGKLGGPKKASEPIAGMDGRSALGLAAAAGRSEAVEALLALGVQDAPDAMGIWGVHWAAAKNSAKACRAFVKADGKLAGARRLPEELGALTPLMLACAYGDLGRGDAIEALLPVSDPEAVCGRELDMRRAVMLVGSWSIETGEARGEGPRRRSPRGAEKLVAASDVNARQPANTGAAEGKTALIQAVEHGCSKLARILLAAGADATIATENGDTALMRAADIGSESMTRALLPLSDPDAKNSDDERALWLALLGGHAGAARLLWPVTTLAKRGPGSTPSLSGMLDIAAAGGSRECVRLALENGADPLDRHSGTGRTALLSAARAGGAEALKELLPLSELGARDAHNNDGGPLAAALEGGSWECVEALLAAGASVAEETRGSTALSRSMAMAASRSGSLQLLEWALGQPLDWSAGSSGFTPLMAAATDGWAAGVARLLRAGHSVWTIDNDGDCAYSMAAGAGSVACLRLIEERPGSEEEKAEAAETALRVAIRDAEAGAAEHLLRAWPKIGQKDKKQPTLAFMADKGLGRVIREHGARFDANAADQWARSPLMIAAGEGDAESVRALLALGADAKFVGQEGKTALMMAAGRPGAEDCVEALLRASDVRAKDHKGRDAWMWAAAGARHGDGESLEALRPRAEDGAWEEDASGASALGIAVGVGAWEPGSEEPAVETLIGWLREDADRVGEDLWTRVVARAVMHAAGVLHPRKRPQACARLCALADAATLERDGRLAPMMRALVEGGCWAAADALGGGAGGEDAAHRLMAAMAPMLPRMAAQSERARLAEVARRAEEVRELEEARAARQSDEQGEREKESAEKVVALRAGRRL